MLSLIPDAKVVVDRSEKTDYAPLVPTEQLICHDSVQGLPRIRNWIIDHFDDPVLVMVDDDLIGVRTVRNSKITDDWRVIRTILDNSAQACADLNVGVFCFMRSPHPRDFAEYDPLKFGDGLVAATFGIMNQARTRKFDERYQARADVDFTLRSILEDRVLFTDRRYYFDHGPSFTGAGGAAGLISSDDNRRAELLLAKTYGRYVQVGGRSHAAGSATTPGVKILRVKRKQNSR